MKTYSTIGTLFLLLSSFSGLEAQSWRFPDCRDLFIIKVELPISTEDKMYISVANQCDTCQQHAYTGLRVYLGADTLAVEDVLFTKPSPENNAIYRYELYAQGQFDFTESLRVEMVAGLCDSLSFAPDWITSTDDLSKTLEIQVFPNPSQGQFRIRTMDAVRVKATRLYDAAGRLVRSWTHLPEKIDLRGAAKGIFWLHVLTDKGEAGRKLVRL
ncbi:MAG: T9SS type A sorting domain-containing protein [Saprospiraceae bacterium]|nr:T9SS type A sorting domain-containing protein [Saprospiraceae bacterium]